MDRNIQRNGSHPSVDLLPEYRHYSRLDVLRGPECPLQWTFSVGLDCTSSAERGNEIGSGKKILKGCMISFQGVPSPAGSQRPAYTTQPVALNLMQFVEPSPDPGRPLLRRHPPRLLWRPQKHDVQCPQPAPSFIHINTTDKATLHNTLMPLRHAYRELHSCFQ
ncbi:hypothetical protein CEXT_102191 [Caerostris extrusa]|uniref:Uncharacterized protein n=1 Tax=Caerostris extrusa TaxID=172846 RepID=A0AAV4QH53_CAEEX|nr:hypothetical protein CEXT_102191 [Caerostris extrusa]